MSSESLMERWRSEAPALVDLTLPEQDQWARTVAAEMLERFTEPGELERLERRENDAPVLLRLAMKLAQSRGRVLALPGDFRISVVFAVYKEHNRLRTKEEHPHGEDFLVRKVEQIEWLLRGASGASWEMLVVDDGCPENSGAIAQDIIDSCGLGDRVKVLFLQDAIDAGHPAAAGIATTAHSQKGGSIEYGMSVAAADDRRNHVVVFTDADLSTHLGQLGLLIEPILGHGYDAAIGSRREPMSVVIKSGARNARGKLFIYLWKRLIPTLSPIIDTQCGFKAFRADVAAGIVRDTVEKRFAFDIELLLRTVLGRPDSIERVAIAWIDSEAASTTTELQPYLPMLKSLVRISEKYLAPNQTAAGFAALIDSLDEGSWARLSSNVPREIAEREPIEFDDYDEVTPEHLRAAARSAR
jgi:hypothetical protein